MKTTIKQVSHNEVRLRAIDPYLDEPIDWLFTCPTNGGYIQRDGEQVCDGLNSRGYCLECYNTNFLLDMIRANWQVYRRHASGARGVPT